jgi:hypothetical protein
VLHLGQATNRIRFRFSFKIRVSFHRVVELVEIPRVPFVEVGRVAPSWSVDELHSDMKWDVGFGVRAMAKGLVVRVDTAVSDEGLRVQMMVSQPFQF